MKYLKIIQSFLLLGAVLVFFSPLHAAKAAVSNAPDNGDRGAISEDGMAFDPSRRAIAFNDMAASDIVPESNPETTVQSVQVKPATSLPLERTDIFGEISNFSAESLFSIILVSLALVADLLYLYNRSMEDKNTAKKYLVKRVFSHRKTILG